MDGNDTRRKEIWSWVFKDESEFCRDVEGPELEEGSKDSGYK